MPLTNYFWHRQPAIDAALLKHFADFIGPGKLVVDVGAGYDPWPYATEFVDREAWPQLQGRPVHVLDVELDLLPYADKSVDFLYCRHTIEDLHNPTLLLREMSRVAKAGYIETPSPIAEFCRKVSGEGNSERGYAHHHWIVFNDSGRLSLLPKYSIIEKAVLPGGIEDTLLANLNTDPATWNTSFAWVSSLHFRVLAHRRDFDLAAGGYSEHLLRAINASLAGGCNYSVHHGEVRTGA